MFSATRAEALALASAALLLAVALTPARGPGMSSSAAVLGPKLVASASVPLPSLEEFEPGLHPLLGEVKLAFLGLETGNPGPLNLDVHGMTAIAASLDGYLRVISDGALHASTDYTLLSIEVTASRIGVGNSSEIVAAELTPLLERYESEESIEGAVLIAWVDTVGLNSTQGLGPSPMHPARVALIGQRYLVDPEASALAVAFYLIEAGTGLESCAEYAERSYPFVNWRPGDLLGPGMEGEPCGPVKVELGWRRYLTLHPTPGETMNVRVNNTEIDGARIARIPLGFVLDIGHSEDPQLPHHPGENWILVKSLVVELRASRAIDSGTPGWAVVRDPGVRLYYAYEALGGTRYSHRTPSTEFYALNASHGGLTPPYFSAREASPVPGYDRFRVTEYTSPELWLELLEEDWPQGVPLSSTLALMVNDSSPPLNYTLSASFYNVDETALVVQVITHIIDGHKVSYGFGSPLEFKQSFLRDDSPIDYYVIFGTSFTADQDAFARNLLTSAFAEEESRLSYAYGVVNSSERMLQFSLDNNVDSQQASVLNYLNLPDLEISAGDLHISEDRPGEGEIIRIEATIHNRGGADAERVVVDVTVEGGPAGHGASAVAKWVLPRIAARSSIAVEGTWNTTGYLGDTYLTVSVDAAEGLGEIDEANNEASVQVHVVIPSSITISLNPGFVAKNEWLTVSGFVSPVRNRTQVRVWYQRPDGSRFFEIVYTASDGSYVDTVRPDMAGRWTVNASCEGDQEHSAAESAVMQFLVGQSATTSTTTTRSVTLTTRPATTVTSTATTEETASAPFSIAAIVIVVIVVIGVLAAAMVGLSRVARGGT